jgi:hypothetical protein
VIFPTNPNISGLSSYVCEKKINGEELIRINELEIQTQFHKWIGAITFKVGTGFGKGTAVLISKNLILTVAHNIFTKNIGNGIKHTDFKFYLAPNGVVDKFYTI